MSFFGDIWNWITGETPPAATPEQQEQNRKEQEKKDGQKAQQAAKVRISEQAVLMFAAGLLYGMKPPKPGGTANEKTLSNLEKKYKNISVYRGSPPPGQYKLDVDASKAGGHIALTNKIFKIKELEELLVNVPNSVLSALVPSVKLYKIFYPTKGAAGLSWRIPFDDQTFSSNNTSQYLSSISEIPQGNRGTHGIGIKSFSYKFIGTDPATAYTNLDCEIELYFQDIRDVVKKIPITRLDPNFQKTPDAKDFKDLNFRFSDLVADSPITKQKDDEDQSEEASVLLDAANSLNSTSQYNDKYYRIKAEVGYSDISTNFLKELTGSEKQAVRLKKALLRSKIILFLTPHSHDLSFNDDGTVTLKIQYVAAISSTFANLNILEIAKNYYGKLESDVENYKNILLKNKATKKEIESNCSAGKDAIQAALKEEEQKAREEIEKSKLAIEENLNAVYSEVFNRIIGNDGSSGFLYEVGIKKDALGVGEDGEIQKLSKEASAFNKRLNITNFHLASWTPADGDSGLKEKPKAAGSSEGANGENKPDAPKSDQAAKAIMEKAVKDMREKIKSDSSAIYIKFVFLGDIIDTFAEVITSVTGASERPRIILTNFSIDIPFLFETKDTKGNITSKSYKTIRTVLNIADIPISLEMLKHFLIERLARPRVKKYDLLTFAYDIFNFTVAPAFLQSLFGSYSNSTLNTNIKCSNLFFSLHSKQVGETFIDPITKQDINNPFACVIIDHKEDESKKDTTQPEEEKIVLDEILVPSLTDEGNPVCNYAVFYCNNQMPNIIFENGGDTVKDTQNGIYHFFIGTDKGLLKKISFSKVQSQYHKEMMASNSHGLMSNGRMREVYDVTLTMFGNNIYKPGDYLYIEPLFYSGDSAVLLQNRLGLGGYYHVIDVETKVNEGLYETSIKAVLYGHIQSGQVVRANSTSNCKEK